MVILPFRIGNLIFKHTAADPGLHRVVARLHHVWASRAAYEIHGDRWVDYCNADDYEQMGSEDIWFGVFDQRDRLVGAWLLYNVVRGAITQDRMEMSAMPSPTLEGDWRSPSFWNRIGRILDYMLENELPTDQIYTLDLTEWRFPDPEEGKAQHVWPLEITDGAFTLSRASGRIIDEAEYDDEPRGRRRARYVQRMRRA